MIRTPDDVKLRFTFSKKWKGKSKAWWWKRVQVHLDNKLLAKSCVRGTYRKKQKSLNPGHVKPNPKLRTNTGSKGLLIMGGVGGGNTVLARARAGPALAHRHTPNPIGILIGIPIGIPHWHTSMIK